MLADAAVWWPEAFLQADLPAPEGPIIKILRVGSDSSDAIISRCVA